MTERPGLAIVGSRGFIGMNLQSYFKNMAYNLYLFNSDSPLNPRVLSVHNQLQDIDTIIWAASKVNPSNAETSSSLVLDDLNNWRNSIQALKDSNWCGKLIFLSSGGCVYNDGESPFKESDSISGVNEYGRLKVLMEQELQASGLGHTIFRISNVYGPFQPHGRGQGVIAEWLHRVQVNEPLLLYGNGENYRDYIHVSDVCTAIEKAIHFTTSDHYNLGTGIPVSMQELIENFKLYGNKDLNIQLMPGRSFDRSGYYLDIQKFVAKANWKPSIDIKDGIQTLFPFTNENDFS